MFLSKRPERAERSLIDAETINQQRGGGRRRDGVERECRKSKKGGDVQRELPFWPGGKSNQRGAQRDSICSGWGFITNSQRGGSGKEKKKKESEPRSSLNTKGKERSRWEAKRRKVDWRNYRGRGTRRGAESRGGIALTAR